ncbi:MAG: FtsX-like permease family protein [Burkholderiales bacterium]|nr:FtsX-like permease family protein [Burkholderiales bacterium]
MMRFFSEPGLALRLLARDWRAGELTLVAVAVVIAVASVTTVGFFADRVHQALNRQANQLLGADLVVSGDRPLDPQFSAEARRLGLQVTEMLRFPSMAAANGENVLAEIKAVTDGYPQRGELRVSDELYAPDRRATSIPAPGTVWVDEKLFTRLQLKAGDTVEVGQSRLPVGAIITQEPDSAVGFINAGPRVMLNMADLPATGLVQVGSRIRYRVQVAGSAAAVDRYRAWVDGRLAPGQRVETIQDARPEIRSALERAEKFLSLTALLSVILAAVAIALAARRYLQRHLDACAMMRCFGVSRGRVVRLHVLQFVALGAAASLAGCLAGLLAQQALALWLGSLVTVELPGAGPRPAVHGFVTGLALLLGFAVPPLVALGRVPPLRVLRRDLGLPGGSGWLGYALGTAVIAGLIIWKAGELRTGGLVFAGFAAAMAVAGLAAWAVIALVSRLRGSGVSWRFGIANLRRRRLASILQVVALGIGIMALLTLTIIRGELLQLWQASLPADAPNRFIVNIQQDQIPALNKFFAGHGIAAPELYPMVRARLTGINDRAVSSADYSDDRARRLVDREFNLSWATRMQSDNLLVTGRWWGENPQRRDQFSMEDGIARSLDVKIGDRLTFDAAGSVFTAEVTSLRKVDWDSFNVNFFLVSPPGLLEDKPLSYVTSFHLPPGNVELLNALVKQFPNFLLIDVAQVLEQVQKMIAQVSRAVQFVFLFTLMAGLVVLYAAIASTQDERLYQSTIMRTLGASRAQLARANLAEFAMIGALAGIIAAAGANALGYALADRIINVGYSFSPAVWAAGLVCSIAGVAAAGYLGTRRVLRVAPLRVLRELS